MRKRLWASGIGVALVGCLALWYGNIDRLNLMDRSTRITSVRGWGLERPDLEIPAHIYDFMSGGAQYQWVGEKQILFFHDLKPIQATITRDSNGTPSSHLSWPASVGTPTLYDVAIHGERSLPSLAALFRQGDGKAKGAVVSPDGFQLLWHDAHDHIHSAGLDGSQHISIDSNGDPGMLWAANSKRFYTYGWSVDPQKKSVFAVNQWDGKDGGSIDRHLYPQPVNYSLLGDCVLVPDGALATNTLHLRNIPLTFYRISPEPAAVAIPLAPTLPPDTQVNALVYSPQGDRLAWVVTRLMSSPMAFLQRWLPRYHPASYRLTSLWVSGVMGDKLHEIGHIPIRSSGRQSYLIDYVRWQPDGKTLSFTSDDALYTVPAN